MPDEEFSHPRLARIYDLLAPDRSDLDAYLDVVEQLGASSVLDIGCGTGSLAALLVDRTVKVLGVDPAGASVEVARSKVDSELAEFLVGTASDVAADPAHQGAFDLATMTANVAQVFINDDDWLATLRTVHSCLRPGGYLVFETRKPEDRGWERWTKEQTRSRKDIEGEGPVESWVEVTEVEGELVSFEWTYIFHADAERLTSTSTLRFRNETTLRDSLTGAGFRDFHIRDLPYAPHRGWMICAQKPSSQES